MEALDTSEEQSAELRRLFFYEPRPFVSRVLFISTPHRGSYRASSFTRRLVSGLISLPGTVVSKGQNTLAFTKQSKAGKFLRGSMPTSLDSMSPENPLLLVLADSPVAPGIKAHSIIPVKGEGDFHEGRDGVVSYQSAHVGYADSEFIVRGPHSCQNLPATIEEVRRILHEHLRHLEPESGQLNQ